MRISLKIAWSSTATTTATTTATAATTTTTNHINTIVIVVIIITLWAWSSYDGRLGHVGSGRYAIVVAVSRSHEGGVV